MGEDVKPKSLCCSYNCDFKSMVIKHSEGNNNGDLACKLCFGIESKGMGKRKGTTEKGRKFNPKRIIKWLRQAWDRRENSVLKKRGMLVLNAVWVTEHRRRKL
jgi:hypothetical protein